MAFFFLPTYPTTFLADIGGKKSSFFPFFQVERKRARNRVAASKCRLRKLERIAVLDGQAAQLRAENEELAALADKLRSQLYSLRQELRWHVNNGCRVGSGKGLAEVNVSPDSSTAAVKKEAAQQQQPPMASPSAAGEFGQNRLAAAGQE